MQRFFVPPETLACRQVKIDGDTARQISRVLRMQTGDHVCLLDGLGFEYVVQLSRFGKDDVTGEVTEKRQGGGEPAVRTTLYLSLLNKAEKFEWALQKCTEIGATRFVPVRSARSISDMPGPSKIERWGRIIQEAAEQSGRSLLPILGGTVALAKALDQETDRLRSGAQGTSMAVMPVLGAELSLGDALGAMKREGPSIGIFIGPEGGFTEEETNAAQEAGVIPVTLGPRTLRAETAAVAALTMALYELGQMGTPKRET